MNALQVFQATQDTVTVDPLVLAQVDTAMAESALIGRVQTPLENEIAHKAQSAIASLEKEIHAAGLAATKPLRDLASRINKVRDELCEKLAAEKMRLAQLCGDYLAVEDAKSKAAESARNEQLSQLERDRESELANAKTVEEIDAIRDRYSRAAAAATGPVTAPVLAEGQSVRSDWEISIARGMEVAFAAQYPNCVKVELLLSEIKALLNSSLTTPETLARLGVTAKKVMRVTNRGRG